MKPSTICIYHANCADGFTAAWAVNRALGADIRFIPASYGDPAPQIDGETVIIVDFSYSLDILKQIQQKARSVLILDHHQSAQKALAEIPKAVPGIEIAAGSMLAVFDMDRSGAQIAWDFFSEPKTRPALVDYVADRDLWKWELTYSREISAWISSYPFDFGIWNSIDNVLADNRLFMDAVQIGEAILRKTRKDILSLIEGAVRVVKISGYDVPVVNLPMSMASEAGEILAKGRPFAAIYCDFEGERKFSLRAEAKSGINVAEIAAQYGGGGHPLAAGFSVPFIDCELTSFFTGGAEL